jgi:UDP-glucose:(heptosyl)LPS alpha-1,3-glucosyltransferase
MNVTLVCERFDCRGGGLEQWVVQLAQRLQRRGHQTRVMAFRANASPSNGITLHLLPWSSSRIERARIAEAALNDVAVDLIHDVGVGCRCHILQPQGGSRLGNEERDTASQSWGERCGRWVRPAFWRWRAEWRKIEYRQYSCHTGLVIAPADKVIRDLETRHVFPRERVRLVPNGVDIDRFSPDACAVHRMATRHDLGLRDETVFLFAAHNLRLKGIRPLLRAISVIHRLRLQVKLLVIGHAPDRHTQNLVDRLEIAPVVLFKGFVPDQVPYYAAADAFVLPTYYDACSLSVLEAAACGLSAITTSDNGVAELITHGHDGFVLQSPDDIDGLASLMIELLDPAVRARVAGPARALAVRHNLEESIGMIESVYDEVLRLAPDRRTS